jgi:hypothetical protein
MDTELSERRIRNKYRNLKIHTTGLRITERYLHKAKKISRKIPAVFKPMTHTMTEAVQVALSITKRSLSDYRVPVPVHHP